MTEDRRDWDYEAYLDWLDEQPCLRCYESNRFCVCQQMEHMDTEVDEAWLASLDDPRRI